MPDTDKKYFMILKKEVSSTLRNSEPGVSSNIEEWKGNDITLLQEDLAQKVNGRISAKWFYTHLKADNDKLPRIDMLDLLSKYAGYSGWNDFREKNRIAKDTIKTKKPKTFKSRALILTGGFTILTVIIITMIRMSAPETYEFCFVDADRKIPIIDPNTQIIMLHDGESPVYKNVSANGCFSIKTSSEIIKFVVKAPYYKTDTITRVMNKKVRNEVVQLNTNDYALVIHYFSTSNIEDWKKRRAQLDNMIADNAVIYQVFEKDMSGMELYNKQEFINKLTMPVNSLKNIEIIETIYSGRQISLLRFYQKDE